MTRPRTGTEEPFAAPRMNWRRWWVVRTALAAPLTLALIANVAGVPRDGPETAATGAASASESAQQACPRARSTSEAPVSFTRPADARGVVDAYRGLPLAFVPNAGQTDPTVRYLAQRDGFGVSFMPDKVVLTFTRGGRGEVLHLVPVEPSESARLEARRVQPGRVSYLLGGSSQTSLPTYEEVAYRDLWPGIDLIFRGRGAKLTYELLVAPGADPSLIRLAYRGTKGLSTDDAGSLLIDGSLGTLRDSRPRSSQQAGGARIPVESSYRVDDRARSYGVEIAAHDRGLPLVVDLELSYSTYLGGTSHDFGIDIAVDGAGSAYVTGQTISPDFPTTPGAYDAKHRGLADAFVSKLDPSGSALVYSTFLGGSQAEAGLGIAVDGEGRAYVSGGTSSPDFPTTPGAFDTSHNGFEDVWVAKLNAAGSTLLYSTFLGGSEIAGDFGAAIAVDGEGRAYVSGGTGSANFPTTPGAFDSRHNGRATVLDAFVAKLSANGSRLIYSTFLGGMCNDASSAIAVDAAGNSYVAGSTVSADFPTTRRAPGKRYDGDEDAFVAKLDAKGSRLVYSTYLGGSSLDRAQGIALDSGTSAYVTGWTESSDFPTTARAFDPAFNGAEDAFVTKLNPKGKNLVYSTYLGGASKDRGRGVAVDAAGSAHVTGATSSPDFPTTARAFDSGFNGAEDAFVTKLNPKGKNLVYSTYLGGTMLDFGRGIAVDADGSAYITGRTESSDFPSSEGAFSTSSQGGRDVFVMKVGSGDAR